MGQHIAGWRNDIILRDKKSGKAKKMAAAFVENKRALSPPSRLLAEATVSRECVDKEKRDAVMKAKGGRHSQCDQEQQAGGRKTTIKVLLDAA